MQPITEPDGKAVPPPLRKHHFDRAAPFLGEALQRFPRVTPFYSQELTPETFARCLRQAIEAKRRYGYSHTKLDDELFARHHQALSIAVRYPTPNDDIHVFSDTRKPAVLVGGRAEVKAFVL